MFVSSIAKSNIRAGNVTLRFPHSTPHRCLKRRNEGEGEGAGEREKGGGKRGGAYESMCETNRREREGSEADKGGSARDR